MKFFNSNNGELFCFGNDLQFNKEELYEFKIGNKYKEFGKKPQTGCYAYSEIEREITYMGTIDIEADSDNEKALFFKLPDDATCNGETLYKVFFVFDEECYCVFNSVHNKLLVYRGKGGKQ